MASLRNARENGRSVGHDRDQSSMTAISFGDVQYQGLRSVLLDIELARRTRAWSANIS